MFCEKMEFELCTFEAFKSRDMRCMDYLVGNAEEVFSLQPEKWTLGRQVENSKTYWVDTFQKDYQQMEIGRLLTDVQENIVAQGHRMIM